MNKMIWRSLLCFTLCAFALTFVSCGDDDDNNTPGGVTPSQQTASIIGKWGINGEKDYLFFNADGTGGFMEYGSSGYHQDGAFRWVQNADGSYTFSGAGLHDGVHSMAIESYDGTTLIVRIQFEGDDKVERFVLKRLSSNPSDGEESNVKPTANIVGNWNIIGNVRSYYRNGTWESEEKSTSAPYDYLFFNADGTGGYMEYGSSGYHQDGEFRWVKNADGSYSFSGEGLHDGVHSVSIKSCDGDNKMEVEVYWSSTKKDLYSLERQIN